MCMSVGDFPLPAKQFILITLSFVFLCLLLLYTLLFDQLTLRLKLAFSLLAFVLFVLPLSGGQVGLAGLHCVSKL